MVTNILNFKERLSDDERAEYHALLWERWNVLCAEEASGIITPEDLEKKEQKHIMAHTALDMEETPTILLVAIKKVSTHGTRIHV